MADCLEVTDPRVFELSKALNGHQGLVYIMFKKNGGKVSNVKGEKEIYILYHTLPFADPQANKKINKFLICHLLRKTLMSCPEAVHGEGHNGIKANATKRRIHTILNCQRIP